MAKSLKKQQEEAEMRMQTAYMNQIADMIQSLPTFAKDADEDEWSALDTGKRLYSEQDITDMQDRAIELYYTDPGARGVIDTMVNFVVGSDAHITPVDENPKVKAWWGEFYKVNGFDMRMKELVRRCFRDGESFLRFFRNKDRKKVPLVRFIEPNKIKDPRAKHTYGIEVDPDDVEDVKAYYLMSEKAGTAKRIKADDIIHTKINVDSNVKRGVSFLVGIAKYIVKYGGWLDDRIRLNKIRTMFNMIMKVTGISPTSFAEKFDDTVGKTTTATGATAKKRLPKSGSVLVSTPGVDYEYKNLNIHAEDTKSDGRLIELQVGKGTNLTEYVVRADSSNSNYSSTMVSESPMVRMFEAWQDIFAKPMQEIYAKVIERGIKARQVPRGSSTECEVNFAALIHRDIKDESEAYASQIASHIVSKKTISEKFGYDYEAEQKQIEKEREEESEAGYRESEGQGNEE
jgi:hypothetical protein